MIVLGNFSDLFKPPDFLIPVSLQIDAFGIDKEIPSFFIGFISALKHLVLPFFLVGLPLLIIVSRYLEGINEGKGDSQKKTRESTRKVSALIPRNYKERCWGFWLSMNAGFSEEIFFRLFAPTLIYTVTGSTLLAICLSTLWFGLAHYYQGFVGVLATTLIGFVLFFIYLYTRSLWLVMLVHVIIDINSLVLDPWLKEYFEKNA